jgi:hypothetical protein
VWRFLRTGGPGMLAMMGGAPPADGPDHTHGHSGHGAGPQEDPHGRQEPSAGQPGHRHGQQGEGRHGEGRQGEAHGGQSPPGH